MCCFSYFFLDIDMLVCILQLAWDETLNSVRTILDAWLEVQNRWNHIAPLFGAQAFHEQLPAEVRQLLMLTACMPAMDAWVPSQQSKPICYGFSTDMHQNQYIYILFIYYIIYI